MPHALRSTSSSKEPCWPCCRVVAGPRSRGSRGRSCRRRDGCSSVVRALGVVVALANEKTAQLFRDEVVEIDLDPPARIVVGRAREAMAAADVVLTASGTASLEATLVKRPMVIAYVISGITHALYRALGLKALDHFALPNLLAGRSLFPEYLQRDVRADVLGPALERQLDRSADRSGWYDAVSAIHTTLRRQASDSAAHAILELVAKREG